MSAITSSIYFFPIGNNTCSSCISHSLVAMTAATIEINTGVSPLKLSAEITGMSNGTSIASKRTSKNKPTMKHTTVAK